MVLLSSLKLPAVKTVSGQEVYDRFRSTNKNIPGSYIERIDSDWQRNDGSLIAIEPDIEDIPRELKESIASPFETTGAYREGDRAFINAGPESVLFANAIANELAERNIESLILLNPALLPGNELAKIVRDPNHKLQSLKAAYQTIQNYINAHGRTHWIVPSYELPEPDSEKAAQAQQRVRTIWRENTNLSALREEEKIVSQEVMGHARLVDVERLNKYAPNGTTHTLGSWRNILCAARKVSYDQIIEQINNNASDCEVLTIASKEGHTVRYQTQEGTDITFTVKGKPIIVESGRVGNNSLPGTPEYHDCITNSPTGELFWEPDNTNGIVSTNIVQCAEDFATTRPFSFEVEDNTIQTIHTECRQTKQLLEERLRGKTVVELAQAPLNQVLGEAFARGLITPTTRTSLINEKLGPHIGVPVEKNVTTMWAPHYDVTLSAHPAEISLK